jgi:beta-glucosidase
MPEDQNKSIFPKNFLWGASTAAHQVEGGTHNQWSSWELAHAQELAKTAKQRLGWIPSWEKIRPAAKDPDNYVSGKGVDHYRRYREDFDIVKRLNMNALRFGIEWSRLQPEKDAWNIEAIEHYREYIHELKARGIEPMLNIWHWTMPTWFDDMGGFEKRENLRYWDIFVERVGREFGKDLKYILTINEPNVFASFGYLTGEWPPQKKSLLTFMKVYWNLTRAHRRAYKILKSQHKHLQIGLATQLANIQAKRPHNYIDIFATRWMRYFWNWWFINRVRRHQDFVGFNYYFTDYYRGFRRVNPKLPVNDLGWYMEPEGLYPIIIRIWSRYKKPIIITENGVADADDQYRRWWLEETLVALERAISEGADVRGYLHWSLLDNFEWKYGWWPKFGLVEVDRKNGMKRTIRPSALWLAEQITKFS